MFFKLLCLYLTINVCIAEEMFASLYKALVANRVTACVQGRDARACAGLVWKQRWVLTQASCVLPYPFASIYVKKGVVDCSQNINTQSSIATGDSCTHHLVAFYKHPMYPEQDLALLQLAWPITSTELIDNRTISGNIINKLDDWLKNINFTEAIQIKTTWGYKRSYHKMYSTPMRMFLVTVVLPSTSFIVLFLFVIFFTGKSRGNKIPYRNLKNNNNKETTYV
ncbi:uncharacterized protein LOC125065957 [Vanessa atalanta]|uniref:uncharacterized protein LOC125065957 n=1 Tax=Vanessa atalanta TaxID=42275 RepID=UPI001FCE2D75|nr:uncharacterized protein LOC125065957 [Vanessa atalanta]